MMHYVTIIVGVFFGLPVVAVLLYSWARTAGGRGYRFNLGEKDQGGPPGQPVQRRFEDVGHGLYRFFDTLGYAYPLLKVYLGRTICPGFREKIMLSTAMANYCRQ